MSATPDPDSEQARMMAPRGPIEYLRANADGMRSMSPSELIQYHRNLEAEPSALSRINLRHERSPMPSEKPRRKKSSNWWWVPLGLLFLLIATPIVLTVRMMWVEIPQQSAVLWWIIVPYAIFAFLFAFSNTR